ncbi:MAG: RagB/SusD family nutrient uptake outer membrane protein [Flavisolibacter sp.]
MKSFLLLRKQFWIAPMLLGCCWSCKKMIGVPPPINQLNSNTVFTNDGVATQAVVGIYSQMMSNPSLFSAGSTTFYAGLSADELSNYTSGLSDEFLNNDISLSNHGALDQVFWVPAYSNIYAANACLEGLQNSSALTPSLKQTLTGEAKFIRAFCYLYLTGLFGDVPLVTSTSYKTTATMARATAPQVYDQIERDLKDAERFLPESYNTTERIRPNKWTAAALRARLALYRQDWAMAAAETTAVIGSGAYILESDLSKVFTRASRETIFELQPVVSTVNTWEGNVFVPATSTTTPTYLVTSSLLAAYEAGDGRRAAWVGSRVYGGRTLYYPYKYKVATSTTLNEYYIVLRMAEIYLIRAEARVHLGDIKGAAEDLNQIRFRAGLGPTSAGDEASLLLAIEQERRIELACEWGHRWLDLKRTGRADVVLGAQKTAWKHSAALWPIPQAEINTNPALTQNPGY